MPFGPQTIFNVIHRSADPVAVAVFFPVVNGQRYFGEFGAHAQQGGYPHPEDGAWSADGNCPGNSGNISCADSAGKRSADCLERGEGAFGRFGFVKDFSYGVPHGKNEFTNLDKAGAYTEIKTYAKDADHGG